MISKSDNQRMPGVNGPGQWISYNSSLGIQVPIKSELNGQSATMAHISKITTTKHLATSNAKPNTNGEVK